MWQLRTAHTGQLDAATRDAARALLYDVFDDMTEQDWDHCLGGVHALAWEADELVGHSALTQRRLLYQGRALRTGYVEGLAVRADRRGHGYGRAMMDALEQLARGAYDLAALGSTDEGIGFYTARGWTLWRGPTYALTPDGIVRTADDDGGVFVLPIAVALDPDAELTCDWRDGEVW
jgi:aminoglycoside 2'-N-acetyltransferase I